MYARSISLWLLVVSTGLLLLATAAPADLVPPSQGASDPSPPAAHDASVGVDPERRDVFPSEVRRVEGRRRQQKMRIERSRRAYVQAALIVLTIGLCVRGVRAPARDPRRRRLRRAAYVGLALCAFASFYRGGSPLFDRSPRAMHSKDVYHYWLGSRYFAELGYGGLYECTLAVADEQGWWWVDALPYARDLTSMQRRPLDEVVAQGRTRCHQVFSDERWAEFTRDVAFFDAHLGVGQWRRLLNDHGYNPSPVWTLLATPLANAVAPDTLWIATRMDVLLLCVAFSAVGWAFGLEIACLVVIAWGTGWLWDAHWVGNAFLRQIWFACTLIGLSLLRKGQTAAAGSLLAAASWVRIFPAVFVAGYGVAALRQWRDSASLRLSARRFVVGAATASIVLLATSVLLPAIDLADYRDFERNLARLIGEPAVNAVGLEPLLWRVDGTSELWRSGGRSDGPSPDLVPSPRSRYSPWARGVVVVLFLLGFWRATRGLQPWEASAATFGLIPVLSSPAGYYLELVIVGVLLASRRPWVPVYVLAACLAWLVGGVLSPNPRIEFGLASMVALGLSALTLWTLGRGAPSVSPEASGSERPSRP